jgi:type IX secretion system PorP/SprF family membrane protein
MGTFAWGQYVPNNGQAFQFVSVTNPAFSGVENFTDLRLGYRHQWSGFGSHSPHYMNLSLNTRLRHPLDLRSNAMRISKSTLVQPENLPKAKRIIHGFGANIFNSKVGIINSLGASFNYSWNYPLTKKLRLSMGIGSVVEARKLHLEDITFRENPDPFYDHLIGSAASQVDLNFRGGALLYSQRFYMGISYLSIFNQSLQASDVAMEDPFYRGSVQTGFSFRANRAWSFKPSVIAYLLMDNSFVMDYGAKAYLMDKGWLGITYRDSGTGIFLIGLNVTELLNVTYSYEVGFGGFQPFGGSSHELVMGLRINNLKKAESWVW